MTRTTFLYVARMCLAYFLAIFFVVLIVFLVADIGDRVKIVAGRQWLDVLELYSNKALVASLQLGPAAVLLAASATIATLKRRGELSALRALSFGPGVVYAPILTVSLLLSFFWVGFDEWVVTRAGARVDELAVTKFNSWGDWRFFYTPKQWFRRGDRIFNLKYGDIDRGFHGVTVFTMGPDFRLLSRLDADHMDHSEGNSWVLAGAVERRFLQEGLEVKALPRVVRDLGISRADLRIRQGRPEQMRVRRLLEQISIRGRVGLSIRRFQLALHNRFAYPLTGVAAALVAIGISLRRGKQGHLTVALMEGFSIAVALWGMMVVGKSLVLAEHIPAWLAAWTPSVILLAVAAFLWARLEGLLPERG